MSLTRFSKRLAPKADVHPEDLSPSSFETHIRQVYPSYEFDALLREMMAAIDRVIRGEITDLMIWVPPGTGKTELVCCLAASYILRMRPEDTVGIVSNSAELALESTLKARDYFTEARGDLDPSQRAKSRWKTTKGGGMWGKGFGGAVRGMRYHWGIVDDPHKDTVDIDSDLKRNAFRHFWRSVWMNRGHRYSPRPIARIVVMQRLDQDDLCGWLLSLPDAAKWTVLARDAIRSLEPYDEEKSGATFIPDRRKEGELLTPKRLPLAKIEEEGADEAIRAAQFQQRPLKRTGRILDADAVVVIHESQAPLSYLFSSVAVDPALRKNQANDPSVIGNCRYGLDGRYYFFRPVWERMEAPDLRTRIPAYTRQHLASVVGVESVAYQASIIQELARDPIMAGIELIEIDADRDKETRARGWSWLLKARLIVFVEDGSGWAEKAKDEMRKFPRAAHDDVVDMVGFNVLLMRILFERGFAGGVHLGGAAPPLLTPPVNKWR